MLETADNQPVNPQLTGINEHPAVKVYMLSRITPAARCKGLHPPASDYVKVYIPAMGCKRSHMAEA
jgi:hypothetical protein